MTIKEAFQLLADSTKKGMKNPFFIMRSLNKNFSKIADEIQGGDIDASDVSYGENSTVEDALDTLNEGHVYSTTEKVVGKWIDGKPLYERTFSIPFSNFTKNNDTYFAVIVSDSSEIIRNVDAIAYTTDYGNCSLGSRAYIQDDSLSKYWEVVQYYGNLALHFIGQAAETVGVSEAIVTYRYTKTTD